MEELQPKDLGFVIDKADELIINDNNEDFAQVLTDAMSKDVLKIAVQTAKKILTDSEADDAVTADIESRFKYLVNCTEKLLESIELTSSQKESLKNFLRVLPLYAVYKNQLKSC
jgi:maltooligosyltrehalose synthase